MKYMIVASGLIIGASAVLAADEAQVQYPVSYPEGYRSWHHVSSMVIEQGHSLYASFGGLHHLYANDKAMRGYASGKFPDGSVIVFDLLEAASADHAVTAGRRKVVGVMLKDSRKYASTGGWGFEGFAGDSKTERVVGAKAAEACFGCHTAQKSKDYVFSRYSP
jgi:hypothetical protein